MLTCKRRVQSCRAPPLGWQAGCSLSLPAPEGSQPAFPPLGSLLGHPQSPALCKHTVTYSPFTHSPGFTMCRLL